LILKNIYGVNILAKVILRKKKAATVKPSRKNKATAYTESLEKRDRPLFTRVTVCNKEFIAESAAAKGISESVFVNHVFSWYRDHAKVSEIGY
jgi:hypothetical protein